MSKIMYKVSQSTGKVQIWSAIADLDSINVQHGELGGKIQVQTTLAEPKNVGRSNATTAEEQAVLEVIALYEARYTNKHYRETIAEAEALANQCTEPRKVHNYKDHADKLPDIVYSSVKVNGSRACVLNGKLLSKIGREEEIKVKHIREAVEVLKDYSFDSEVYAHGLSLQRIRGAWLKPVRTAKEVAKVLSKTNEVYDPNEDASKLQLHIFDIPVTGVTFEERLYLMSELEQEVIDYGLGHIIKFIFPKLTHSKEERLQLRNEVVAKEYEGLVHYTADDLFEFGKRSYTCQKDKPRYDSECLVTSVEKCKNGDGKLVVTACDDLDKVKFKVMMKVSRRDGVDYPRDVASMEELIGQWITFSYEELSGKGIPTKPIGEEVRKCNAKGEPIE